MSTSIFEMTNPPLEIEIAGRKLKVRRLSIRDLFAAAEAGVVSDRIKLIHQMANGLQGKEKIAYIREATKDIPTGQELAAQVPSQMASFGGMLQMIYAALKKDQPEISEDEIGRWFTSDLSELKKIADLIFLISGVPKPAEPDNDKASETPSEKKEVKP